MIGAAQEVYPGTNLKQVEKEVQWNLHKAADLANKKCANKEPPRKQSKLLH